MIVHLVRLNRCHRFGPPRFSLPLVEDLAFLIQAHSMGLPRLSLGSPCLGHLNDPFLRELESLRLLAELGAPLVACHIDLTNAFWWSLIKTALECASMENLTLCLACHLAGAFRRSYANTCLRL